MPVSLRPQPFFAMPAQQSFLPRRIFSLACSLALHTGVVTLLMSASGFQPQRTYEVIPITGFQLTPDQKSRIVWYSLRKTTPAIDPGRQTASQNPKIHSLSPQRITAAGKTAGQQVIHTPAPEAAKPIEVRAPNMLAIAGPQTTPKIFAPPVPAARPRQVEIETVAAPELDTAPRLDSDKTLALLKQRVAAPPRPFTPPPAASKSGRQAVAVVEPAPELAAAIRLEGAGTLATVAAPKLPVAPPRRAWAAPPSRTGSGLASGGSPVVADLPPEISGGRAIDTSARVPGNGKSFYAPPPRAAGGSGTGAGVKELGEAPPEIVPVGGGTGAAVTAAVIGLNPVDAARVRPPEFSRRAELSAGKTQGTGSGLPGSPGGLNLPGVSVEGPRTAGGSVLPSVPAAGTPRSTAVAGRSRPLPEVVTVSTPLWPHTRSLRGFIEARFQGRLAYVTSSPTPAGGLDWVLWFAEQGRGLPANPPVMRPPVIVNAPSLAALARSPSATRIHIAGVIARDGTVNSLTVLNGPTPFDAAWIDALGSLRFAPARRNGTPIDVDVVVEIPLTPTYRVERK